MSKLVFAVVTLMGVAIAIAFLLGGMSHGQDEMIWMGLAMAVCSPILGYWLGMQRLVIVCSRGGGGILLSSGMVRSEQAYGFVESVEYSKAIRVQGLLANP